MSALAKRLSTTFLTAASSGLSACGAGCSPGLSAAGPCWEDGTSGRAYRPFHSGLRFCMKASMPSPASSDIMLQAIVSEASW